MRAYELFIDFCKFSPITRPVRAMILAYGYVLRGEKVEKPIAWGTI